MLEKGVFQASAVTVDLRTLKSDQTRRDNALKTSGLETDKYPTAEFHITGVDGATPTAADGREVPFKLTGTMKVHGTEKPLAFDAKATVQGDTLKLIGQGKFNMKDFGITPPSKLGVLSVDENVQLDVSLTAKRQ